MPGFNVPSPFEGTIGETDIEAANEIRPFTTYTWRIPFLFGEPIKGDSPIIFVKDATTPSFNAKRKEIQGSSLIYKYADSIIWDDIRLSFYDITSHYKKSVSSILEGWRKKVWDETNGIGTAGGVSSKVGGYKLDSQIDCYTYDDVLKERWTLKGSWPQSIRYGDLTYTESNVKLVEVVVTYDYAVLSE